MHWYDSRLSFRNLKSDQFNNWVTQVNNRIMLSYLNLYEAFRDVMVILNHSPFKKGPAQFTIFIESII